MSQQEIPTDRSIQIDQSVLRSFHQPSPISFTSSSYYVEKMSSHLEFVEAEFIKNIQWQKQILFQIKNEGLRGGIQKYKENLKKQSECLQLKPDQQHLLKIILTTIIGQGRSEMPLKEMIRKAAITISKKQNASPPTFTFSPTQKVQEQPLKFPVLQRVITLNDLAPRTQRQLTPSPSLPPRTPKSKHSKQKQNIKAKQLFTPSPYQREKCQQSDFSSIQKKDLREQSDCKQEGNKKKDNQLPMQDSLGKRLFQDCHDKLIYIKDQSEEDLSSGSEVSLNLSQSNFGKQININSSDLKNSKMHSINVQMLQQKSQKSNPLFELNNYSPQNHFKDEKIIDETLYLKMYDQFERGNKKSSKQISQQGSVEGLCFGGHPKRKIGKCVIKKENYFAYQQNSSSNIRKMHDSFGLAYQQYYSDGPNYVREECIYQCRNTMHK